MVNPGQQKTVVPVELSVCILTRNQRDILKACLHSCQEDLEQGGVQGEVIVIDNASADGTVAMVQTAFPQVILLRNSENMGFSKSNNQAIQISKGNCVLILNDDTVIRPGCFRTLLDFMNSHPRVGASGPKLLNRDGSVQVGYHRRLPTFVESATRLFWMHHFWPNNPIEKRASLKSHILNGTAPMPIEQIAGCSLLLRQSALDQIGFLDEGYFFWYEDVDLCERLLKAGWEIYYLPAAQVVHYGGAAASKSPLGLRFGWQIRGILRFYRKHRSKFSYRMIKCVAIAALTLRLPIVGALCLAPSRETRQRWREVPLAYLRIIRSLLVQ